MDPATFRTQLGSRLGGFRRALRLDNPLSAEDRDGIAGYLGCIEQYMLMAFHRCLDISPSDQSADAQNLRDFVAVFGATIPEEIRVESLAICEDLGRIRRMLLDPDDDLGSELQSILAEYLEVFEGVFIDLVEQG
jgi:hypothetical protein